MDKNIHECLLFGNTSGWITRQMEEYFSKIDCYLDWSSDTEKVHIESEFMESYTDWNKKDIKNSTSTRLTLTTINKKKQLLTTYLLNTNFFPGHPQIKEITGDTEIVLLNGGLAYNLILKKLSKLLNNKNIDDLTASILTYVLKQMQLEKSNNTSCPEFLSKLVELGKQQKQQKIEQRQNTSEEDTLSK